MNLNFSFDPDFETLNDYQYNVVSLANEFVKSGAKVDEESLKTFLYEKAEVVRAEIKKIEAENERKKLVTDFVTQTLLKHNYTLTVSCQEIVTAFLKTGFEPTGSIIETFVKNYHHNYRLLLKQENANYLNVEKQALQITAQEPMNVYGNNIYETLYLLHLLKPEYRSQAWFNSPEYQ